MQTLHISHYDLYGLGCGVLITKFMPLYIKTAYLGYDDIDRYIEENYHYYDRIIITDVSPQYGTVEMLAGEKDVLIIDHHASSDALKDFHFTHHDITKCATMLTYEYLLQKGFKAEEYEEFARCINDVDMWFLKREDSLKMSVLFNLMGITRMEERFLSTPYTTFTDTEKLMITLEEERRDNYIKKAMRNIETIKDKDGLTVTVVFAESYASELGNYIISEDISDYVMLINAQSKKVSLRSRKDVDIRHIAERNGGGGHKNAAAFSIKNETFDIDNLLKNAGVI